ncbi:hypothetical protein BX659_11462 [Orenia metallireducens]|uniref:MORN repeat variant n=1 Tax=Orenia metallireducens TaxID=1413210 RepID=A0A285IEM1_9FIRM|nr:hypothetical protein [Orenia metallireducens]PRX28012.1 hypothetical protein BX659_11462 [Orenia metallireducens]SNY45391.1 hypothetical protein SAMN06265827_1383 [Orenia metallireducens]
MREANKKYGILKGVSSCETYSDGEIKSCRLNEYNLIETPYGLLVPQYEDSEARRKYKDSISFYENGEIKSISLNKATEIEMKSDVYKAERILFYESGEIRCIFPLDGKVTGYWTEENEYELAEKLSFDLKCGKLDNKVINIRFYKDGAIKSITLWPQERAKIKALDQELEIHIGLSLYQDGLLESCEPIQPTPIETPIGTIMAYDCESLGINGDINSLKFYRSGELKSLKTSTDIIEITNKEGNITIIEPGSKTHPFNNEIKMTVPVTIEFEDNSVSFTVFEKESYQISDYKFTIKNSAAMMKSQCASCIEL